MCLRKIKFEVEFQTIKGYIDHLLTIYWRISSKVIFWDQKWQFWTLKSVWTILKIFLSDPAIKVSLGHLVPG